MPKDRLERTKKPLDIEVIILKDGKEIVRYKPKGFVSCGILGDLAKDKKIEARMMSFGQEHEMLYAFHLLAEELVSKFGESKVLLALRDILAKSTENFMAEMRLRAHAENTKGEKENGVN